MHKWNLKPSNKLVTLNGRVLPLQEIASNTNKYYPEKGNWTKGVQQNPMYTSVKVTSWVVISPKTLEQHLQKFLLNLKRVSDNMSFFLPRPQM